MSIGLMKVKDIVYPKCFVSVWSRSREINNKNRNRTRAIQRGEWRRVTQCNNTFKVKYNVQNFSDIQTRLLSGQQLLEIMDTEWESLLVVICYTFLLLFTADLGPFFIPYVWNIYIHCIFIDILENLKLVSDQQERGRNMLTLVCQGTN